MELFAIIVTVMVLLDVVAFRKGSDSRDRIGDDWARPTIA